MCTISEDRNSSKMTEPIEKMATLKYIKKLDIQKAVIQKLLLFRESDFKGNHLKKKDK